MLSFVIGYFEANGNLFHECLFYVSLVISMLNIYVCVDHNVNNLVVLWTWAQNQPAKI